MSFHSIPIHFISIQPFLDRIGVELYTCVAYFFSHFPVVRVVVVLVVVLLLVRLRLDVDLDESGVERGVYESRNAEPNADLDRADIILDDDDDDDDFRRCEVREC